MFIFLLVLFSKKQPIMDTPEPPSSNNLVAQVTQLPRGLQQM